MPQSAQTRSYSISPQEAAIELLKRRQARKSLLAFTEYTKPEYQAAPHHKLICDHWDAVFRGEIKRLLILAPPSGGKSELSTRRAPAFYLGRDPKKKVISASYNDFIASDFGRDVQDIIKSPEYQRLFPETQIRADAKAAGSWRTPQGGTYISQGLFSGLTGRHCHLGIIDDPIKNSEEAYSERHCKKIWDMYTHVFYLRLLKDAPIVVCLTHWSELDLAARLLADKSEEWKVLKIPAIQDGESFWEEQYSIKRLEQIKAKDKRMWQALFMQDPQPETGTYFEREHEGKSLVRWYDPKNLPRVRKYMTSDFAVTDVEETKGEPDFTEIGVHGIDAKGDIYLDLDSWYGQTASDVWIEQFCDLVQRNKPLAHFSEGGVIRRALEPIIKRRLRERNLVCRLEWLNSIQDKPTKNRAFQGFWYGRRIWLPDNDAGHRGLSQMLKFPSGKHDDWVDKSGFLPRALDMAHPAISHEKSVRRDPYAVDEEESWKTV